MAACAPIGVPQGALVRPNTPPDGWTSVAVRSGETFDDIARSHAVPVADLALVNGLTDTSAVVPGDRVFVPETATYTIQSGDSIYRIAERVGVTRQTLIEMNALTDPDRIRAGDVLRLPPSDDVVVAAVAMARQSGGPFVRPGDTVTFASVPPPTETVVETVTLDDATLATPGDLPPAPVVSGDDRVEVGTPGTGTETDLFDSDPFAAPDRQIGTEETVIAALPPSPAVVDPGPMTARFRWPLDGSLAAGIEAMDPATLRNGLDIEAPLGTPIRAAGTGRVIYAGNELRAYGNLILIRHEDDYITAYAHADDMLVGTGDLVQRGQQIATVGRSGQVSRPLLHFEVRQGTETVNPLDHLPPPT